MEDLYDGQQAIIAAMLSSGLSIYVRLYILDSVHSFLVRSTSFEASIITSLHLMVSPASSVTSGVDISTVSDNEIFFMFPRCNFFLRL